MLTKPAIISAVLGCLCFSPSVADEITDERGNVLYGRIAGFSAAGVVFHQNCGDQAQTFSWDGLIEARFSGDCSAAKSWRGGGDPPCEWIEHPKAIVGLMVEPENVPVVNGEPVSQPFGTASEFLGITGETLRYRDVCTGKEATITTRDLIMRRSSGYCKGECQ